LTIVRHFHEEGRGRRKTNLALPITSATECLNGYNLPKNIGGD